MPLSWDGARAITACAAGTTRTALLTRGGALMVSRHAGGAPARASVGGATVVRCAIATDSVIVVDEHGAMHSAGTNVHGELGLGFVGDDPDRALDRLSDEDVGLAEESTAQSGSLAERFLHDLTVLVPCEPLPSVCGGAVAVAAGDGTSAVVTGSGDVYLAGQLSVTRSGRWERVRLPSRSALATAASIAPAGGHAAFVCEDGRVFAIGDASSGQLAHHRKSAGPADPVQIWPPPPDGSSAAGSGGDPWPEAVDVRCGNAHTVVLAADGSVWTFGLGAMGQLGVGAAAGGGKGDPPRCARTPQRVGHALSRSPCVAIAAGANSTAAVTVRGALYVWGSGRNGRLGIESENAVHRPALVSTLAERLVIHVALGAAHGVCITEPQVPEDSDDDDDENDDDENDDDDDNSIQGEDRRGGVGLGGDGDGGATGRSALSTLRDAQSRHRDQISGTPLKSRASTTEAGAVPSASRAGSRIFRDAFRRIEVGLSGAKAVAGTAIAPSGARVLHVAVVAPPEAVIREHVEAAMGAIDEVREECARRGVTLRVRLAGPHDRAGSGAAAPAGPAGGGNAGAPPLHGWGSTTFGAVTSRGSGDDELDYLNTGALARDLDDAASVAGDARAITIAVVGRGYGRCAEETRPRKPSPSAEGAIAEAAARGAHAWCETFADRSALEVNIAARLRAAAAPNPAAAAARTVEAARRSIAKNAGDAAAGSRSATAGPSSSSGAGNRMVGEAATAMLASVAPSVAATEAGAGTAAADSAGPSVHVLHFTEDRARLEGERARKHRDRVAEAEAAVRAEVDAARAEFARLAAEAAEAAERDGATAGGGRGGGGRAKDARAGDKKGKGGKRGGDAAPAEEDAGAPRPKEVREWGEDEIAVEAERRAGSTGAQPSGAGLAPHPRKMHALIDRCRRAPEARTHEFASPEEVRGAVRGALLARLDRVFPHGATSASAAWAARGVTRNVAAMLEAARAREIPFAGRTREVADLDAVLAEPRRDLFAAITGEPGVGKSHILCAWLARQHVVNPAVTLLYHDCSMSRAAARPEAVARSLLAQARLASGSSDLVDDDDLSSLPPREAERALRGALAGLASVARGNVIVAVDALDEMGRGGIGSGEEGEGGENEDVETGAAAAEAAEAAAASIRAMLPAEAACPERLRFVATCRPGPVLKALRWRRLVRLRRLERGAGWGPRDGELARALEPEAFAPPSTVFAGAAPGGGESDAGLPLYRALVGSVCECAALPARTFDSEHLQAREDRAAAERVARARATAPRRVRECVDAAVDALGSALDRASAIGAARGSCAGREVVRSLIDHLVAASESLEARDLARLASSALRCEVSETDVHAVVAAASRTSGILLFRSDVVSGLVACGTCVADHWAATAPRAVREARGRLLAVRPAGAGAPAIVAEALAEERRWDELARALVDPEAARAHASHCAWHYRDTWACAGPRVRAPEAGCPEAVAALAACGRADDAVASAKEALFLARRAVFSDGDPAAARTGPVAARARLAGAMGALARAIGASRAGAPLPPGAGPGADGRDGGDPRELANDPAELAARAVDLRSNIPYGPHRAVEDHLALTRDAVLLAHLRPAEENITAAIHLLRAGVGAPVTQARLLDLRAAALLEAAGQAAGQAAGGGAGTTGTGTRRPEVSATARAAGMLRLPQSAGQRGGGARAGGVDDDSEDDDDVAASDLGRALLAAQEAARFAREKLGPGHPAAGLAVLTEAKIQLRMNRPRDAAVRAERSSVVLRSGGDEDAVREAHFIAASARFALKSA